MRRILRIWPLFYFCVFFGFFIFPLLKQLNHELPNETAHLFYYLTFLNNFDFIKNGLPDASMLGVLWSVAIEEQFYLVWPVLLSLVAIKRYDWVFITIVILSFVFRYLHADQPILLEHHTLSCISDLAIGGLAAFLVFNNQKFKCVIENAPGYFWAFVYLTVAIVFFGRQYLFHWNAFSIAADRLLISIIFALVILEQCFAKNALYQMSRLKLASKLGIYTYGLYCLHFFGILIVAKLLAKLGWNKTVFQVLVLEGFISLALTILIAFLSYKYFESPFLKLKSRFARIVKGNEKQELKSGSAHIVADKEQ